MKSKGCGRKQHGLLSGTIPAIEGPGKNKNKNKNKKKLHELSW